MSDPFNAVLSVVVVVTIIVLLKIVEKIKFQDLEGSYKATTVIIILVVISEAIYLAISFSLLKNAIETVTSLSALLIFFAFVYLNKLQNAASGLSLALSSKVMVGEKVKIDGKKGTIVKIGLTKTIVEDDDSKNRLYIPNKKFDEVVVELTHNKKKEYLESE